MQEMVKNDHKNGVPRCAVKLDLMKAMSQLLGGFFSIFWRSWSFLIPALFIHWIKQCVTTAMFSVVINGELKGYFPGKRGLEQGDPLSPYLFLLVMESFTTMFNYGADHMDFLINQSAKILILAISFLLMTCSSFVGQIARHSFQLVKGVLNDFL